MKTANAPAPDTVAGEKISEWLARRGSHDIYNFEKISADFTLKTGQEWPDYVTVSTVGATKEAIVARGLGGNISGEDDVRCVWGYAMAADFSHALTGFVSNKFGRGRIFSECIDALRRAGF